MKYHLFTATVDVARPIGGLRSPREFATFTTRGAAEEWAETTRQRYEEDYPQYAVSATTRSVVIEVSGNPPLEVILNSPQCRGVINHPIY